MLTLPRFILWHCRANHQEDDESMIKMITLLVLFSCVPALTATAQQPTPQPTPEAPTTSIPPNFSRYTLNLLARPTVLGVANERVEEKLGRRVPALRPDAAGLHFGW